ncbi:MAG TPA: hypothetical protein VGR53_09490 [Nitrososphaerales archaeon]|nr:hypothetical protein [Nitrososphaerales archaeon]
MQEVRPAQRPNHLKRNVAIVGGVVLVLVIAAVAISGFVFGLYGCFGRCGEPFHAIYPTALSCGIQNDSCEVVISNNETSKAQALGCEFQSIYAINGNNQSLTTVNIGAGVLSNKPEGPAMTIAIAAGTSVTVYCIDSTQPSSSLKVGGPAVGEVLFTNQSLDVQFRGTWR